MNNSQMLSSEYVELLLLCPLPPFSAHFVPVCLCLLLQSITMSGVMHQPAAASMAPMANGRHTLPTGRYPSWALLG
jgi:hypothetical protein